MAKNTEDTWRVLAAAEWAELVRAQLLQEERTLARQVLTVTPDTPADAPARTELERLRSVVEERRKQLDAAEKAVEG